MKVLKLGLIDYRNYESLDVEFDPHTNVLLGQNGQGKTNVVEAIAYLATFSSHRVAADAALVRAGCDHAIIRSTVAQDERSLSLDVQINASGANRVQVNQNPVRRMREALGIVRAVMFAPEDLSLVKGEPSARRRFIDQLLVQQNPRYAAVISDFEKSLKQRNSLLRSAARSTSVADRDMLRSTLDVWNDRLVEFGSDLVTGRLELLAALNEPVTRSYASLTPARNAVGMRYRRSRIDAGASTRDEVAEQMRDILADVEREELARGVTVVGPHRDDVELELNDLPARGYASHGESWSLALALRLASFDLLQDVGGGEPVLILDDVFAELDQQRRSMLAGFCSEQSGQLFVTAAVASDVPESVSGVTFFVDSGSIK